MKYKVAELEGALLDAAVAKAEGLHWSPDKSEPNSYHAAVPFSTQWAHGGPIIEREGICLQSPDINPFGDGRRWYAGLPSYERPVAMSDCDGSTPLIAAMRAYVASKLGEEVELP